MSASDLLVKIEMLDDQGKVIEERLATTFRKLLEAAHAEKLTSVDTSVLQYPSRETRETAVVRATITTSQGTFTGIGDAGPESVPEKLRSALVRVAETRALCRALRTALCVPYVAVEELGDKIRFLSDKRDIGDERDANRDVDHRGQRNGHDRRGTDASPPRRGHGRDERPEQAGANENKAMSDAQRKLLFRLAFNLGATKENVRERVIKALGVDRLEWATRLDASKAIDTLKREATRPNAPHPPPSRTRGNGHSGPNGPSKEELDDIPF